MNLEIELDSAVVLASQGDDAFRVEVSFKRVGTARAWVGSRREASQCTAWHETGDLDNLPDEARAEALALFKAASFALFKRALRSLP